jgi:hypothetical protein
MPETTQAAWLVFGVGMLGALALGAGVFGQWIKDPPIDYAVYLIVLGAIGVGIALWYGELSAVPVRVGDAGIAIEKGSDIVRAAWCDLESVRIERGQLLIRTQEATLTIPIAAHAQAVAWALSEGVQRMPDAIDVRRKELKELPKPDEQAGESLKVEGIQMAGNYCRESEKLISFENDARVCPNCFEVYHRLHIPADCATCGQPLGERALKP